MIYWFYRNKIAALFGIDRVGKIFDRLFIRYFMKIEKVHAVYFSPTGTTKTVITHLVKCITTLLPEVVTEVKDFTLPSGRKKVPDIRESELAIVGLPVYAGRLPNLLLNYLTTWQSNGAWAVPVVVYGNRSYGECARRTV